VGTVTVAAGWSWAVLLVVYFGSSVALTRFRAGVKAFRTDSVVAKGGPRDATQVLANGFVFALAAALWLVTAWEGWRAIGVGALAAAASDTWATEIGTLSRNEPRSVLTWRPVPTGTSGGVSAAGAVAAIAGSVFIALVTITLGWPREAPWSAFVGGVAGSTVDSLLGATVQQRRWCDQCDSPTERARHRCGVATRFVGGMPWIDNDVVNVTSTLAGALLGLLAVA
jgi:uncharacterized protein (TIGR00297 family)